MADRRRARPITRRDFLNGIAIGAGSLLGSKTLGAASAAASDPPLPADYYPPALTGMRGSTDASFAVAHTLRDGAFWEKAGPVTDTAESYDLVVVGAGISGLSAAHFFRKATGPAARVLLLDNHDDFGGHARRDEFRVGGRMIVTYGGSQSIESPGSWSPVARGLLQELGVETRRFYAAFDQKLYASLGLGIGSFFDKQSFGADRLVVGLGKRPWPEFLAECPLSDEVRRDVARVYTEKVDYLKGLTPAQKRARLAKTSYAEFLTKLARMTPDALPFFQNRTHDLFGVGIDAVSALACLESGDDYGIPYAGFQGLGLSGAATGGKEEPYIFHFPDGNASIARLLVRALIPGAVPGHSMEDVVTARADYARLDQAASPVRLRLNSTVARVRHQGSPATSRQVEVTYVEGGRLKSVRAGRCVLACWNGMIPHLCPELPEKQRDALAYGVKVPLVYTQVLIRNWTAFRKLGIEQVVAPGSYFSYLTLDFPVSLGSYAFPRTPEEPMAVFMLRTPCSPGLPARDQHRAGRVELLTTPFATFEQNVRDQLGRVLSGGGFDSARDIAAITVNRWSHGYAYEYNSLWDPVWPASERPCVLGRKRFGRIAIANSDAAARAYADAAIDQAHRAVSELLGAPSPA